MVNLSAAHGLLAAAAARYSGIGAWTSEWNSNGMENWKHSGANTLCAIQDFTLDLPTGLTAPTVQPVFIGLAFGVQNYTCTNANNYTSTGAVAELIDVSCYVKEPWFPTIQEDLYNVWTDLVHYPVQIIIKLLGVLHLPEILCQHYFVPNPVTGQGLSPKWDFTSSGRFTGNKDAFVTVKAKASAPAPTDPKKDVAWLDVVNIEGKIADEVFRTDTVGGQPPTSCKYGYDKDISVKYVSKYVFFGGSIY